MQEALKKKAEFERRKREVSDGHCQNKNVTTTMCRTRSQANEELMN